jgi:hypothetical protein
MSSPERMSSQKSIISTFVGRTLLPMIKSILFFLSSLALLLIPFPSSASLIPVKHKEGTVHGFLVLRSQQGRILAAGDLIQTIDGDRVTEEVVFHFRDGSIHDEVTVFSQNPDFRLISDHLRQQGPSFPKPIDIFMDVASGNLEISSDKDKGSKQKTDQQHLQIPEDAANGLIPLLLKNISPSEPETTVSMVTTTSKPRVVKLQIHPAGEQAFSASGERFQAIHYVVHVDIGGVAGAVAHAVGKQPSDIHCWIVGGKAPAFVKLTAQLYEGGPVWNIELATVRWLHKSPRRP